MTMFHPDGRARATVLIASAMLALSPDNAHAQATGIASAGSAPAKSGPVLVSDIVVVSRHRKERAQRVPVAITSVTAKQLVVANIDSVAKLPQLVPSLQVTDYDVDLPIGRLCHHDLTGYLAGNLSLRTSFHPTPDDSACGLVPGHGLLNLQFGVRSANQHYDLSIFIDNALNQNYYRYLAVATPDAGIIAGAPGDPLTFGATLRIKL